MYVQTLKQDISRTTFENGIFSGVVDMLLNPPSDILHAGCLTSCAATI